MNNVQLYIQGKKVDLFGGEKIELKSTIQDVRDIGKVFTDFSQTFTVPASAANNKIFSHFYVPEIVDGYDGRTKKSAEIFINYNPFRRGKIMLEGVDMKNNKPFAYRIKFFGNTVTLKDLFGEDELSDLPYLRKYDHQRTEANVKTGFTTGLDENSQTNSIIYPLITPEKRLYYDSGTLGSSDADGNLYKRSVDDNTRGLSYNDLKPAIKCIHIIEAIEDKYGIAFTRDFFDTAAFTNLYMWLHRNKKNIPFETVSQTASSFIVENLSLTSDNDSVDTSIANNIISLNTNTSVASAVEWEVLFQTSIVTPSGRAYTMSIVDEDTNLTLATKSVPSGGFSSLKLKVAKNQGIKNFSFQILEQKSMDDLWAGTLFDSLSFTPVVDLYLVDSSETYISPYLDKYTGTANTLTLPLFQLRTRNITPKIKVIDFLTGIFKMFNLTAHYIDDVGDADFDKIKIDTLDNFYADAINTPLGEIYDITEYIDVSSHTTDASLPFTNIEFKYEEPKTLLAENHLEQFKIAWGSSSFEPTTVDVGNNKYELKVPFERLKLERLFDIEDGTLTDIMTGYSAGGDFKVENTTPPKGNYQPRETAPILFYGIRETSITNTINFIEDDGTPSAVNNYWRPSSTNEAGTSSTAPAFTLNFDNEVDEWNLQDYSGQTNSLFKKFYENYVTDVFEKGRRIYKFNAFLPDGFITNYRLNNKLRVGDRIYRINSITTSLITGKSILELLNHIE